MRVTRRQVLVGGGLAAGAAAAGLPLLPAAAKPIPGSILGANSELGHLLRSGGIPEPASEAEANIVIVGGGIAGLSAAWHLQRQGITDFQLLELEKEVGGNASSGQNSVSAYPWGAHYVPLPTKAALHTRALFEELGVITGYDGAGLPIYNEYYLCADPHERLYMYGKWQEDLLPQLGISDTDRQQYQAFFGAMEGYKTAYGTDGRKAFTIPLDLSSGDPAYRELDRISIVEWMHAKGWDSAPLHWYVNYCCRDDYGTTATEVSAWAGIHYFAARDGTAANADPQTVITWPEGNGWLVKQLKAKLAAHLHCAALVWRVQPQGDSVAIDYYDPASKTSHRLNAKAVILATPHFIADRLLNRPDDGAHSYAPWMVANVTLDKLPQGYGAPLCWDNVMYDSPSLGYVVATQQSLEREPRRTVITYYWPLDQLPPAEARKMALGRPYADWQAMILEELLRIHPELRGAVRQIDVWLWGHGMIRPTPGYLWGEARQAACRQTPPVFYAHSDMSGISIFEEAQYRGVLAADAVREYLAA